MAEGTSLEKHLTTFKEIVVDLETLEVKYEEDLGLIFFVFASYFVCDFQRYDFK